MLEIFREPARLEAFRSALTAKGFAILPPTNEWEVLRVCFDGRTSVVYRNKQGRVTVQGADVEAAAAAFASGADWTPNPKRAPKMNAERRKSMRRQLIERDGNECFYCGNPLVPGRLPTIEHLLARAHQGPNRLENMTVSCKPCNEEAGDLTLVEKVKLRDQKRRERATS